MMLNKKVYLADVLTKGLTVTLALSVCAVSQAQLQTASADGVEKRMLACANNRTDSARLVCYDRIAEDLAMVMSGNEPTRLPSETQVSAKAPEDAAAQSTEPEETSAAPVPSTASSTRIDPTENLPESVSSSQNRETFETDVERKQSIRVMIEKTKRNTHGNLYFYFDNGEVWKQAQAETRRRRIPALPAAATVSRGLFSSYKLHIDGQVWAMKIRRVK